jgi:hypothetical protein
MAILLKYVNRFGTFLLLFVVGCCDRFGYSYRESDKLPKLSTHGDVHLLSRYELPRLANPAG